MKLRKGGSHMFQLNSSLEAMIRSKITSDKLVLACGDNSRMMAARCGDACTGTCKSGCQGDKIG